MAESSAFPGRGQKTGSAAWGLLVVVVLAAGAFAYFHFQGKLPWKARSASSSIKTVEEGKREALRRYPALGTAGTRLNHAFVERYKLYQQQRPEFFKTPEWPVLLVEEIARSLEVAPVAPNTSTTANIPEYLKAPFAIWLRSYPEVDAKKFPKFPADSVWLFRALSGEDGTVEVGFEKSEVVYMIFHRGVGGRPWTLAEIVSHQSLYSQDLLKGAGYRTTFLDQIRAAAITRFDFDVQQLRSGQ